ncbi:MAG: hypothetical protein LBJ00_11315 [Planctomycetaceae bacterium]|nr:hypothetical protein [Planctomycetaceae bacterium]
MKRLFKGEAYRPTGYDIKTQTFCPHNIVDKMFAFHFFNFNNLHKKIMKNKLILVIACGLILVLVGCSGNVKVNGTVKYSDGSALTVGTVVFGNGTNQYQGDVKDDGTFQIEGLKTGSGIPKGEYKVWLANTTVVEYQMKKNENGDEVADKRLETVHVVQQFNSPETSGLSANVDTSHKTFDFKVERP